MVFNISQNNRWEFVKYYLKKKKKKGSIYSRYNITYDSLVSVLQSYLQL